MPTRLSNPGMNLGRDIDSYEQWINFRNHKLQMLKNLKNKKQYSFRDTKEFFNPNNEMLYNYENISPTDNELENLIYQQYISKNNNNVQVEKEEDGDEDKDMARVNIPEPITERPDLNNCIPCKPCKPCKS